MEVSRLLRRFFNALYIRKMVQQHEFPDEYAKCFSKLLEKINEDKLTITNPPMTLFFFF